MTSTGRNGCGAPPSRKIIFQGLRGLRDARLLGGGRTQYRLHHALKREVPHKTVNILRAISWSPYSRCIRPFIRLKREKRCFVWVYIYVYINDGKYISAFAFLTVFSSRPVFIFTCVLFWSDNFFFRTNFGVLVVRCLSVVILCMLAFIKTSAPLAPLMRDFFLTH